jgi:hypothetical protein
VELGVIFRIRAERDHVAILDLAEFGIIDVEI